MKAKLGGNSTDTNGAVRVRRVVSLVAASVLVAVLAAGAAAATPSASPAAVPALVSTAAPTAVPTATPEPIVVAQPREQAPRKLPPGGGSPILLPK